VANTHDGTRMMHNFEYLKHVLPFSWNVQNNLSLSTNLLFNALTAGLKVLILVHPLVKCEYFINKKDNIMKYIAFYT
jgi:hypothetical protein